MSVDWNQALAVALPILGTQGTAALGWAIRSAKKRRKERLELQEKEEARRKQIDEAISLIRTLKQGYDTSSSKIDEAQRKIEELSGTVKHLDDKVRQAIGISVALETFNKRLVELEKKIGIPHIVPSIETEIS